LYIYPFGNYFEDFHTLVHFSKNGSNRFFIEVLLAITGKDFVLTASDATVARSIVLMKQGEDKSRLLNKNTLMLYSGEQGDAVQFSEFIQKNVKLYSIRHGYDLSPPAVAHYVRREMADSLRTRVLFNSKIRMLIE
jgi:20S proteasome subunit beta 4